VQDENISLTGRKQILEKIADITGKTELKKIDVKNLREGTAEYEKLSKAIDLWGKTVIKNAQIDIYAKQAAQAETEVDQLQIKLTELQDRIEKGTSVKKSVTGGVHPTTVSHKVLNADAKAAQKEMQSVLNEIETKQKFIDNAEAKLSTLTNDYAQLIEDYRNYSGLPDIINPTDEFVFTTQKSNSITDRNVRIIVRKALDKAGISNYSAKDFRHSFAAISLRLGAAEEDVKRQLGWHDKYYAIRYKYVLNFVDSESIDYIINNDKMNINKK
jgi:hypothetical protein